MGAMVRESEKLVNQIVKNHSDFNFFQVVRLIEEASEVYNRLPIGYHHSMEDEALHFNTALSLIFPVHDISNINQPGGKKSYYEMSVSFLGIFGQTGALPEFYTEQMQRQARKKHTELADFLNLFNHRLISFYYRAWEKNNLFFSYQRSLKRGTIENKNNQTLKDSKLNKKHIMYYYAGFFSQWPRNAINLAALLSDYFELPIKVSEFEATSQILPKNSCSLLSYAHKNNQLNREVFLGRTLCSFQSKIQINIGPIDYTKFSELFPTKEKISAIYELAKFYISDGIILDIRLILSANSMPPLILTHKPMMHLAWNTWLSCKRNKMPKNDVVFSGRNLK